MFRLLILCSILFGSLTGCALPPAPARQWQGDASQMIYVVRRELHTGIAIDLAQWPEPDWPLLAEFPTARYLEFGLGDAIYYQAREKTVPMTFGAVFWPSASVIEVLAQTQLDAQRTADYDVVAVPVTQRELREVTGSIAGSFAADPPMPTGTAWSTQAGDSRFYHARGSFHFFRLCNRWTAQQLRAAGCSLSRWPVILPSQVMRAARRCEAERLRAPQ